MHKKTMMAGVVTCLLLGVAGTMKADEVPPATPPASFVDSDVVKDWHGTFALGLNIAKGNSDTLLFNAAVDAEKDWKMDEWKLGADGAYGLNNWGHSDETQSANNIHGIAAYRHLFSERFYGGLTLEGLHDEVAMLAYRVIVSPVAGYYFIKEPATRLRGEVGPAYIAQRYLGEHDESFIALRFTERFEHDFSPAAKIWEQVDYLPHVGDFGNYLLIAEIGAEAALNSSFSLRVVVQDKFNSRPPADTERNDILLLASVVYKFGAAK